MKAKFAIANRVISATLTLAIVSPLGVYIHAKEQAPGWKGVGDATYYMMEGTAKRATGLTEIDDNLYYFSGIGELLSGWKTVNGDNYYFDETGKAVTGKQTINGVDYNFTSDGKLRHGWSEDGTQYYDDRGFLVTSQFIQDTTDTSFYLDSNGIKMTGWAEIDGSTYYFSPSGEMAFDNTEIDGKKYYFNSDGKYITGWEEIDGKKVYHSQHNGMILRNQAEEIDGILRYFGKDGQMLSNTKVDGYEIDKNGVAKRVKTQAEKEAEQRKKEEEEAKRIAEEQKKAYEAQQKQLLAQRQQSALNGIKVDGSTASRIAQAAMAQLGATQDCTMLATNALASAGISFHDWPENYSALGSWTSNPVPGDLCIYQGHIAVYVGNGQAVHGGWNGYTTALYGVGCSKPFMGYIHVGG